ncbi:hypothetical protein [Actinomadura nitritigenes]|uniref:hypothetical protein n=1 Tax=Actinomadura nitritigenes TaxID=134602 RepID=UPI003D919F63
MATTARTTAKTRTARRQAAILADLEAIDHRLAVYDAEGVGRTDFRGARARAALHDLGAELAYELGELCADAGDRDSAAAAEARQDADAAACASYRRASEAARPAWAAALTQTGDTPR